MEIFSLMELGCLFKLKMFLFYSSYIHRPVYIQISEYLDTKEGSKGNDIMLAN